MTGVLLWGTAPELGARLAGHDPVMLDETDAQLWALASSGSPPDVAVLGVAAGSGLDDAVRRRTWLAAELGIGAVAFAITEAEAARVHQLGAECAAYAQRVGVLRVAAVAVPGGEHELEAFVSQPERAASPAEPPAPVRTDQIRATVIWAHRRAMLRGRAYAVAGRKLTATVAPIRHRLDLDTLEPVPATQLRQGEVGDCDLVLSAPIEAEPYDPASGRGGLLLIDPLGGQPAGVALTRFALRRGQNVHWQSLHTTAATRARHLGQTPCVLWLTGLSGAGKSTIADAVEVALQARGHHTYLLDGDNVRHGLNHDLGFTDADRVENIRRVAEVAKLMVDAGLIVLVSFISPFVSEREMARGLFEPDRFFEVHVDTTLAVAEGRDPKGLYAKARRGELRNFTGIDSPYEPPEHPDLRLETAALSVPQAAQAVLDLLTERGLLD